MEKKIYAELETDFLYNSTEYRAYTGDAELTVVGGWEGADADGNRSIYELSIDYVSISIEEVYVAEFIANGDLDYEWVEIEAPEHNLLRHAQEALEEKGLCHDFTDELW